MQIQSIILVSNYSNDQIPAEFTYSSKQPGAGYHNGNDGVHTAVYELYEFSGTVKIQATLALYPGDNDWFDISKSVLGGDSTVIGTMTTFYSFSGKFVWIRAAYQLDQGTITHIRFSV